MIKQIRQTGQYALARAVTEYDLRELALRERQARMDEMRLLMELRGSGDARLHAEVNTRLVNLVRDPAASGTLAIQAPRLKPLSQLLGERGYGRPVAEKLTSRVCCAVSAAYKAAHGKGPEKVWAALKQGRDVRINAYTDGDWSLINTIVEKYLEAKPIISW